MKKFFKDNWKFLLFVLIGGLIGGYFLGVYGYDSLSVDQLKELQKQNVTKEIIIVIESERIVIGKICYQNVYNSAAIFRIKIVRFNFNGIVAFAARDCDVI